MKKSFFFLALIFLIFTLSCNKNDSSSGGAGGQASSISNLSLGQNRAVLNEGSGRVKVFVSFEYLGGEGDLAPSVFYYASNGNPVYGIPAPIRNVNGTTRGGSYAYIDIPTGERRIITIYVFVTDRWGRTSNWLSAPFEII